MRNTGPHQGHQAPSAVRRGGRPASISRGRSAAREFGPIRAAFEEHSVLLFRDQPMDDEKQIEFSEYFGPLETTGSFQPRRRHQVPAPVEPRHPDRRADPAGRHAHDLPEGELLLALGLLVQAGALAVLGPDRAHLPARRRQHRIPQRCAPRGMRCRRPCRRRFIRWWPSTALSHSRDRVQKGILSAKAIVGTAAGQAAACSSDNPGQRPARALHRRPCRQDPRLARGRSARRCCTSSRYRADQPEYRLSHATGARATLSSGTTAPSRTARRYYDAVKYKRFMQRTTIGGDELTVAQ